jgi:hypothetical protein
MKSWIRFCSVVIAAALIIPALHSASAANVFKVQASLQGRIQGESQGKAKLASQPIQNASLVNVVRGRNPSAQAPANEVLAAVIDCNSGIAALIVWDTNSQSNLVTVALLGDPFEGIAAGTKAEFIGVLDLQSTGNMQDGITGGFLTMSGKATIDTNGCPSKVSVSVVGIIDATFTDDMGTHSASVLIPKGTMSTQGSSVGTISGP